MFFFAKSILRKDVHRPESCTEMYDVYPFPVLPMNNIILLEETLTAKQPWLNHIDFLIQIEKHLKHYYQINRQCWFSQIRPEQKNHEKNVSTHFVDLYKCDRDPLRKFVFQLVFVFILFFLQQRDHKFKHLILTFNN